MKIARRIAIVALCYLLSSYGMVLSLMLAGMSGSGSWAGALVGLLILLAWVCHLMMSVGWIVDRPARRGTVLLGTCSAMGGLMLWPMADLAIQGFGIADILRASAIGMGLTLPCVLLALYFVKLHLQHPPALRKPYRR